MRRKVSSYLQSSNAILLIEYNYIVLVVAITELAITTFNDYKEMFPTCVKNAACWGAAVLRRGGNYRYANLY